jgi:hypothetical protein
LDIFGQDDRPTKLVDVYVKVKEKLCCLQGPVTLFNKIVGSARGRDSGAKVGEGIIFLLSDRHYMESCAVNKIQRKDCKYGNGESVTGGRRNFIGNK